MRPVPIRVELIAAYANAHYEVARGPRWVDCDDPCALQGLPGRAPAGTPEVFAVLSACNPGSRELPARTNRERHQGLCAELRAAGLPHWAARGRAPDARWMEASVLVQAPLAWIDAAARRWQQNAVWLPGAMAELRLYADPPAALPCVMANLRLEWVGCGPPESVDPR